MAWVFDVDLGWCDFPLDDCDVDGAILMLLKLIVLFLGCLHSDCIDFGLCSFGLCSFGLC